MPCRRLFASLKFRIVAVAVLTGVVSALGTAMFVLDATEGEVQRMLLDNDRRDRERTAALLTGKLETLKKSLSAVARHAGADLWLDPRRMEDFLLALPALGVLFDAVFAAAPDGSMLARIDQGQAASVRPSIADREYFQRAMQSDQPVVSDPLLSKVGNEPMIIVAVPVLGADGSRRGVVAGAIRLRSNSLFPDPVASSYQDVRKDMRGRYPRHYWPENPLEAEPTRRAKPRPRR